MRYTPEHIDHIAFNEVFVYGSNQFAKHEAGAARKAIQFGAIYEDCPMGLCGQSYGIITKSFSEYPVTLEFIRLQILTLYEFATLRPEFVFLVTKIGTNLAGFTIEQIADLFPANHPENIVLPKEFEK